MSFEGAQEAAILSHSFTSCQYNPARGLGLAAGRGLQHGWEHNTQDPFLSLASKVGSPLLHPLLWPSLSLFSPRGQEFCLSEQEEPQHSSTNPGDMHRLRQGWILRVLQYCCCLRFSHCCYPGRLEPQHCDGLNTSLLPRASSKLNTPFTMKVTTVRSFFSTSIFCTWSFVLKT